MPVINSAIHLGTKIFKADLAVRRTTNKVKRLSQELSQAQDAKYQADSRLRSLKSRANGQDLAIAEAVKASYFAD
jgi:hypothetical protein